MALAAVILAAFPAPSRSQLARPGPSLSPEEKLAHKHAPGRLLVRFSESLSDADVSGTLGAAGAWDIKEFKRTSGLHLVGVTSSMRGAIEKIQEASGVLYVEPNYVVGTSYVPSDPDTARLWGVSNDGQTGGLVDADIDGNEAWDVVRLAPGIVIAGIDSGIDYNHPDLAANMWTNPGEIPANGIDDDANGFVDDVHGWDCANDDSDPLDDNGHGTHTAGTFGMVEGNGIGAVGVAHRVQIMALKFLRASGFGLTSDAIECIEYSTLMGADISNNSWGGGGFSQALLDAIEDFGAQGGLFVAAAGNGSSNNDLQPLYPASYTPESDNVVSVAATDHTDQLALFSNFGTASVDLGAPGVNIYSTIPTVFETLTRGIFSSHSGTSMAAAHVAGAAALYRTQFPDATPAQLKAALIQSSDKIPSLQGGKTTSGGRLNLVTLLATKPEEPGSCSAGEECRVEADFGTFGAGCVPLPPDDDLPAEARNETDCKFDVRIDDDGELDRERLASVSTPLDIDLLFTLDTLVNAALAGAPSPCVLDEEEWEEEGVAVFECEGLASFTDGFLESAIIDQGIPGEDDGMTAELTVTPENGIAFSIGQPSSILNFNSTAFGVISGTGDEGHHSISGVSAGDLLTLETETPNSLLDSTLELVDVEGKQVAFNDDFFGVNSFISINAPGDGEYTAIVRGYPGGIFGPGVSTSVS